MVILTLDGLKLEMTFIVDIFAGCHFHVNMINTCNFAENHIVQHRVKRVLLFGAVWLV